MRIASLRVQPGVHNETLSERKIEKEGKKGGRKGNKGSKTERNMCVLVKF
jgi:hypothetical protein